MYWTSLPYALETLRQAGVTEEDCLNLKFRWSDMDSFSVTLDNKSIKRSSYPQWRHYLAPLPFPIFSAWGANRFLDAQGMRHFNMALKRLKLYENGRLIGPGNYRQALIQRHGIIGWMTTGSSINFASPDNSSPAQNGRTYRLTYVSEKDWKWQDKPSFNEKLVRIHPYPDIKTPSGTWCAVLDNESPDPVLVPDPAPQDKKAAEAALKRHTFTENGKVLSGWKRDQNLIIFKTSDNTDPRTNGREYRLVYKNGKEQ